MPNTPNHVAIIMDGNRRWAKKRRLEALLGHDKGAETLKDITKGCADAHINWLTVFAFSSENWTRPEHEVAGLMRLIAKFIDTQAQELLHANVRLRIIGRRDRFADDLCVALQSLEQRSSKNTRLNLTVALDYGGRQDIASSALAIAKEIESSLDWWEENGELFNPKTSRPADVFFAQKVKGLIDAWKPSDAERTMTWKR